MARNGSGTFSLPVADFSAGATISSSDMNSNLGDIETALTQSIAVDGQTPTTARIPFASGISTDTIAEVTSATGVTVDGVLLKDSQVTTDVINEKTSAAGVTVDSVLLKDGLVAVSDGAVGTPAVRFASDADTGIYRVGSNNLGISAGGGLVLDLVGAATPVNYLRATSAAANGVVALSAQGSDTNIGLSIATKGTDPIQLLVGTLEVMRIQASGTVVNYWQPIGTATGVALSMEAAGTDTNIGMNFVPKGSGTFQVGGTAVASAAGALTAAAMATNIGAAYATGATAGAILQSLAPTPYTSTTDLTTQLPADDTVPGSSEGTEILSQAITPVASANKVRVRINGFGSHATGQRVVWALFRGTTYIGGGSAVSNSSYAVPFFSEIVDSPSTTSSTTYSLRVGPGGGSETVKLNYDHNVGSRLFGGSAKVTMVVEEIKG